MRSYRVQRERAGIIQEFGGGDAPPGWLLCDGSEYSRTTYARLFAAIGTTHGVGDGSTTFNVPDCRGRVTVAPDDMGGSAAGRLSGLVIGGTLGDKLKSVVNNLSVNDGITINDTISVSHNLSVANKTLTTSHMPSHRHNSRSTGGNTGNGAYFQCTYENNQSAVNTSYSGSGNSHNHGLSGNVSKSGTVSRSGNVTLAGSIDDLDVVQPSVSVTKIIKV